MTADARRSAELTDLIGRLVAIDSVNPALVQGGAGEQVIAGVVADWLTAAGLEVQVEPVAPGRPNVIGVARGSGGGRTLLLLGHTDTVTKAGMADPLTLRIAGDALHGRGAYDMKSGLAAAMTAAASLVGKLRGDLVIAAVCDEEAGGIGTRALLDSGVHFDAAIIPEPTDLAVGISHKGFAGFEIETSGVAAHGSRPDLGEDAIVKMGPVLVELAALARRYSLHASLIQGGEEESSYPARCLLTGEWRTDPGDEPERVLRAAIDRSGVDAALRIPYTGSPFLVSEDEEIVALVREQSGAPAKALSYWTDAALLQAAGIPTVLFGPSGGGAHAAEEWVDLASVERVREVLIATAQDYCGRRQA